MKTKNIIVILISLIMLAACGPKIATQTIGPTQVFTPTPIDFPTPIQLPTFPVPIYATAFPYPTASAVQANAVAFITREWENPDPKPISLWIANTDGSGERRLVESLDELSNGYALMWSPNGKWISYRAEDGLWIVSPDGLMKRKILTLTDKSKGILYTYAWSPDSSQIAYVQASLQNAPLVVVGLVDLATGEVSELSSYQSPLTVTLSWSPDGQTILLSKDNSFIMWDVKNRKAIKQIPISPDSGCDSRWYDRLAWSPDGKWFYQTHHGNGRYSTDWTCVTGLDGSNREIHVAGSSSSMPVWDKTGNHLYFTARNANPDSDPNIDVDYRLMSYDVRTQEINRILSLGDEIIPSVYLWSVSTSPDRQTLEVDADTKDSEDWHTFIFLDPRSPSSATKFSVNFKIITDTAFESGSAWAPDNQNIIFLAGDYGTPDTVSTQLYGEFHTLNIQTGKTAIISGKHEIEQWAVSPIAAYP